MVIATTLVTPPLSEARASIDRSAISDRDRAAPARAGLTVKRSRLSRVEPMLRKQKIPRTTRSRPRDPSCQPRPSRPAQNRKITSKARVN